MNIRERIRDYLGRTIGEDLDERDDIFELGLVDSLYGLQLVMFVENEFSVVVEGADLDIANFSSISALTSFVQRKVSASSS